MCTLQILTERLMPKLAELYSIYIQNVELFEDCLGMTLDCVSALSQIFIMEEQNFYEALNAFLIFFDSIFDQNELINYPDTHLFCHAITLLSTLAQVSDEG